MTSSPSRAAPPSQGKQQPRPARTLRSRDFLLFFAARASARLDETMLPVALSAGLLLNGGGATEIGFTMACYYGCFAGFTVFGGVFSDRFDTLRLMIGADLVRVLTQGLMAVAFLTGHVVLWQLCALSVVGGLASGVFQPGVASTVRRVADDVQAANGAIRTGESLAMLAGPAFAGLLVGLFAPGAVFAVCAATYGLSAVCLVLLRLEPVEPRAVADGAARPSYWADLAEGWREFRSRTWLWGTIVVWMVLMVAVTGPLVPLASVEIIGAHDARTYGLVSSALGAGTALGALAAMRVRPVRPLRAGALALLGYGAYPAAVGAQLPWTAVAACAVLAGAGAGFWSVMWATSVQTQVPGPVLNRIHAYEVTGSVAMMPVGQALAGPVASLAGAQAVLLVSGGVAVAVSCALLSVPAIRGLRRVDARP